MSEIWRAASDTWFNMLLARSLGKRCELDHTIKCKGVIRFVLSGKNCATCLVPHAHQIVYS
jgi:hypothetical protein